MWESAARLGSWQHAREAPQRERVSFEQLPAGPLFLPSSVYKSRCPRVEIYATWCRHNSWSHSHPVEGVKSPAGAKSSSCFRLRFIFAFALVCQKDWHFFCLVTSWLLTFALSILAIRTFFCLSLARTRWYHTFLDLSWVVFAGWNLVKQDWILILSVFQTVFFLLDFLLLTLF